MPRSRITRGKLAAEVYTNGLIASAINLTARKGSARKVKRTDSEWQNSCWYFYDTIEVYHYGVQWVGNTLSRAKLVILKDGKASDDALPNQALDEFFGGRDNQGEFLRQAAIHMTVAGEGYCVAGEDSSGREVWFVAAAVEVKNGAEEGHYKIDGEQYAPNDSFVMRFWRPHPRKPAKSDSPTRPLLPVLKQLEELTMYVSAQLDSRITNAGILIVPQEVTFPTPYKDAEGNQQQVGFQGFLQELAETMAASKEDRDNSSSRVPMGMMVPGDMVEKVQHLTLWSSLDEHAKDLREETIRRIALGMDMPPEALLGTGDVNHWGAWAIDDSLIKSHAEPLLALIVEALTHEYLRIWLVGNGMSEEEAALYEIGADTSEMRLRPNRSKEAMELWDRGELSAIALRRENGFDETDAMEDEERKTWLLYKLAQGSPSPELVEAAAKALGIDVDIPQDAEPSGERPLPRSLAEHPTAEPPSRPSADQAALLAAGEAALFHALTRAGNKIRSTQVNLSMIPKEARSADRYLYVNLNRSQLDFVLDDAWDLVGRLTLPEGMDREKFETALDNYARMLITQKAEYDRDMLARYLALAMKDAA